MSWQPQASVERLQQRARLLRCLRDFFAARAVMEVDVPALGQTTVTEANIESISALVAGKRLYLQTSPEYFMKRLLAAGSGAIYSLAKAYRQEESGRFHNPEFTMLEWYRPGFDDRQLAAEVVELIHTLAPQEPVYQETYAALFTGVTGLNPHTAETAALEAFARDRLGVDWRDCERSVWLDLLFSHLVEPEIGHRLQVVFDYPACQSALAKTTINESQQHIARRFEVYWRGLELANGYWELTDAKEQRRRFVADSALRAQRGNPAVDPDEKLLQALEHGLPECAGVALGVDRLLMCISGAERISEVLTFCNHN